MARHKSPQLSLENLQDISDEYKSFSQISVGLVSLAVGIVAFVLYFTGYPITFLGMLMLLVAPIAVGTMLAFGDYFGIRRRIKRLEAQSVR